MPALLVLLAFRERLADYGAKLGGAFTDGWVYLVMLAAPELVRYVNLLGACRR